MQHKPKYCQVADCGIEASKWITPSKGKTFYLCSDCASKLYNENEEIVSLDTTTGEIITHEVGQYCCHAECEECSE